MKTSGRQTKLTIVLGYTGTGKTSFVKRMVNNELRSQRRRALIIMPDDREWTSVPYFNLRFPDRMSKFVGVRKIIYHKGLLEVLRFNYKRGLLIFDDCRGYMKANLDEDIHNLLIRRRQNETDIVAVGHGFTEVPPKFFTFCSQIVLFWTKDNIAKRKDDLSDYEKVVQMQAYINEQAKRDIHHFEIIPM